MTKVSVIVPVYNAENTIQVSIESILKQSIDDMEVIVINDGSTDATSEILKQYAHNPLVKIYHQVNQGVSAARNAGLSYANGEYVFFLDSDDTLDETTLSTMYQYAVQNDIDLLSCWHREPETTQFGGNKNEAATFVAKTPEEIGEHFLDIFPRSACAKLFRREIINSNQLSFSTNMSIGEDMTFVYEFLMRVKTVGLVSGCYYNIQNVNPESLSKRYVKNIENVLHIQNNIWSQLTEQYPRIEDVYYNTNMDFRFYLASLYVNNLFKFDAPYTAKERLFLLDQQFRKYSSFLEEKIEKHKLPKNTNEKIVFYLLKFKNPLLIYSFYTFKEWWKRRKV